MSLVYDLSRLESVIVARDYHGAVASIDHGDGRPATTATANEFGFGAAMAMSVLRDGEYWSVVVIAAAIVSQMMSADEAESSLAFHHFLHELVHVDELRLVTKTYPGGITACVWTWSRMTGWRRVKALMHVASAPSFVAMPTYECTDAWSFAVFAHSPGASPYAHSANAGDSISCSMPETFSQAEEGWIVGFGPGSQGYLIKR